MTGASGAGGLSNFSSGSFGSGLGGSVWLEATAISERRMTELSKPGRSIPKQYTPIGVENNEHGELDPSRWSRVSLQLISLPIACAEANWRLRRMYAPFGQCF